MSGIPPLAGLCTYEEAAVAGYTVEQNVHLLVRYAWIMKRSMEAALYWINPTPEWEVKEALSLHCHLDADHAGIIRQRISEMRNPPPNMDKTPDDRLDRLFSEVLAAQNTLEKMVGLYGVVKSELLKALQVHYETTNPLVDHPTRRILRVMIGELQDAVRWGGAAVEALLADDQARSAAEEWASHVRAYLQAAGGVMGTTEEPAVLPASRAGITFEPDFFPQRDERFAQQWNFFFPCHVVAKKPELPVEERTLALMCKRALEMDVPEAVARMIAVAQDRPWDYYVEMCRQLWDEARHAMMGAVYFENHDFANGSPVSRSIDWRKEVALHPGFSLHLNSAMTPQEAHLVLYVIEQSLMNAKTGKKLEWETAIAAHDPLASLFQDYDWADEVLHAQIGRRWILPQFEGMSREEILEEGRKHLMRIGETVAKYRHRGEQRNWWPDFVRRSLHAESQMQDYGETIFTSG